MKMKLFFQKWFIKNISKADLHKYAIVYINIKLIVNIMWEVIQNTSKQAENVNIKDVDVCW